MTMKRSNTGWMAKFGRWVALGALMVGFGASVAQGAIKENFECLTTSFAQKTCSTYTGTATLTMKTVRYYSSSGAAVGTKAANFSSKGGLVAYNANGIGSVSFYYKNWTTKSTVTLRMVATVGGQTTYKTFTFTQTGWLSTSWTPGLTGTGAASFSVTNSANNYRFFIDEFTLTDGAAPAGGATSIGNSYIVVNSSWYNGSGSGNTAFSSLGTMTSDTINLGGQVQTYGENDGQGHPAHMYWAIKNSGGTTVLNGQFNLPWGKYESNNNWFGTGTGSSFTSQALDISSLTRGTQYTLSVWFSADGSNGQIYDSNSGNNFNATFTTRPAPSITVSPTTLTASATNATAGAASTFTVSGANLDADVTVTASSNYEICKTSGGTYSSSLTLPKGSGTLSSTTVYVRMKASASTGAHNSETLTVASTGATSKTVTLSGAMYHSPSMASTTQALSTTVNTAASYTRAASGAYPATITYSITSGTGASVSSSGAFSYTPSAAGTYNFTIQAANGITPNATYTITVTAKPAAPTVAVNGTTASTISGTISGLTSGATVMLRMYDSASAANSDTTGTSGTDVSANVTVSGTSGTWSVSGVDGCTARSFKAWQTVNSVKSDGSAAATGTTVTPGAPSVTASATPDSVTLSWAAVAGATHYIVNVCPASASSSAKAVARGTVTDTLTRDTTGITQTSYTAWSGKTVSSEAVYAGTSAGGNTSIQLRTSSNTGVYTTSSGGKARKVTVVWNTSTSSNRGLQVYGRNTAYTSIGDVWGSAPGTLLGTISYTSSSSYDTEVTISGDYEYIALKPTRGALYLTSITIDWETGGASCLARDVEVAGTSWTASSGVVQGTTYEWSVVAVGGTAQCTSSAAEGEVTAGGADQAPTFAESSVSLTTTTGEEVTHTQTAVGYPTAMTYSITAGSGATVGASTGEFSFTPSAAGTYAFTVQAANGVAPNATYTIDVTVKPVKPTVTVTTEGAGSLSGTVTGTESGATVNLRRYESQAAADADTTGTGGTAVTVTSGAFTDTGLAGCTTYYYKVWQTKNSQTSAGSAVASGTAGLAGPTVTVSAQTESSFTMTWGAVAGASSYLVQVATDDEFSSGSATVLEEDFSGFGTAGGSDGTTDISASLDGKTSTPGWWGEKIYTGGGRAKLGRGSAIGYICTPPMSLPNGGTATFSLQKYGTDTGSVKVDVTTDDVDNSPTWTTLTTIAPQSTETEYTVTLPAGATVTLSFETTTKRAYVCSLTVEGGSGSGSLIYSAAGTSPTTVSDLEPGTYYYRVQSVGGGSCETWSSIGNVTLVALQPTVALSANGTTAAATVAAGTANHVLAKFALATTVTDATLNGLTFTTTGTATSDDLENLKVYRSASSTFSTGSATLVGTLSSVAAGSHSLTGLTETLTSGSTAYFYVVVDVKALANPARTVAVSALSTSSFTLAQDGATKNGSCAASGTQTVTAARLVLKDGGTAIANGDALTMGPVVAGSTATKTITVQNTGNAALSVSLSKSGNAFFTASSLTANVAANSSATFTITYAPTAVGNNHSATFTVSSSDPTRSSAAFTVNASATGTAPAWTSSVLASQTILVGQTLSHNLANDLSAAGSPAATITRTGVTPSAPAGSCSVSAAGAFTYAPTSADNGKTFVFTFQAANIVGSATATMSVTVVAPQITVNGSGNFGAVTLGQDKAHTFTLQNSGTSDLTISAISLTGTGFTMPAWTSQTVPAGQSTTVTVTFRPMAAQSYTGTLTITSDSLTQKTYTVSLSGSGQAANCEEHYTNTYSAADTAYTIKTSGGGGAWTQDGNKLGLWAHSGNNVAAFRKFTLTGDNSGTARPLQIGDEFSIWLLADGTPNGYGGISFNDSVSFSSFSDNYNTRRFAIQLDNGGLYKTITGSGDQAFAGKGAMQWRKLRVKPTSSSTVNIWLTDDGGANEAGQFDLPMMNSPGTSSRIQSIAMYLSDDNNKNWYWQAPEITDTGAVEFGLDNGTRTISGVIADGLTANCSSGSRPNRVCKCGTGDITFTAANTYSGGTQIEGGSLKVTQDSNLGSVPSAARTNIYIWRNATLRADETFTLNAYRGIAMSSEGSSGDPAISVASGKTLTFAGRILGSATWDKLGGGTLSLSGTSDFTGGAWIAEGKVVVGSAGALGGATSGQITIGSGATLELAAATVNAQKAVFNSGAIFKLAAGQKLHVAQASTTEAVQFDISGDSSFVGDADKTWTLVDGAAVTANQNITVTMSAAQTSGTEHGLFRTVADANGLKLQYYVMQPPTIGTCAFGTVAPNSTIALNWTKWQTCSVLIVRRPETAPVWTPATGTTYTDGTDVGNDTVIIKGSCADTSFLDTGLQTATSYVYHFYSEHYGHYSALASVTVSTFPTVLGNDVYWRADGGQTSGDWEQDGAWWYRAAEGVGFAHGNMTDWGPNNVYINNDVEPAMTIGVASTVNKLLLISPASEAHTIAGSAALTILEGLTNTASGGSLTISAPLVMGSSAVQVYNTKTTTLSGAITGESTLTKTGAGTLTISGAVANTVDFAVSAGILDLRSTGSIGGEVALSSGATFRLTGNASSANVISGAGNVTHANTGTGVISGNNTYTGTTTVNAGTLKVAGNNALGNGGAVSVAGGSSKLILASGISVAGHDLTLGVSGATFEQESGTGTWSGNVIAGVDGVVISVPSGAALTVGGINANAHNMTLDVVGSMTAGATAGSSGTIGKSGAGTLTWQPQATSSAVALTIAAGTLSIGGSYAGQTVTANSGSTVAVTEASTLAQLVLNSGSTLSIGAGTAVTVTGTGSAVNGNVAFNPAADASFDGTASKTWTIVSGSSAVTLSGSAALNVSGTYDGGFTLTQPDANTIAVRYIAKPAAPSLSATGGQPGQISITVGGTASGQSVVVVRNESGTFSDPTSGTAIPSVGDSFCGGTVIRVGAAGTFDDTDLAGCSTYYYKAWNVEETSWSDASAVAHADTSSPAVPTLYASSNVGSRSFDINWSAIAGATKYLLDVSTNSEFCVSADAQTTARAVRATPRATVELFNNAATTPGTAPTGWTYNSLKTGVAYLYVTSSSGYVESPVVDTRSVSNLTFTCTARTYGGTSGSHTTVTMSYSTDGSNWTAIGTISASSATLTGKTLDCSVACGLANVRFRWTNANASGSKGVGMAAFVLSGEGNGGGGDDPGPGPGPGPDPQPQGRDYVLVTDVSELTEGDYVIVNSGDAFAMVADDSGGTYLAKAGVTVTDNAISDPSADIIWHVTPVQDGFTLYSADAGKYITCAGEKKVSLSTTANTTKEVWALTMNNSGAVLVSNVSYAGSNYRLQYNSGSPRFTTYTGSQQDLHFYKCAGSSCTPDYVSPYRDYDVAAGVSGATGTWHVTVPDAGTYYYRLRAVGADMSCISDYSSVSNVTLTGTPAEFTWGDNPNKAQPSDGTPVRAGSITNILMSGKLTVTSGSATLNSIAFTTVGTATSADIANFKVWRVYPAGNYLPDASAVLLGTFTGNTGAGVHLVTLDAASGRNVANGNDAFICITADFTANAAGGHTVHAGSIPAIDINAGDAVGTGTSSPAGYLVVTKPPVLTFTAAHYDLPAGTLTSIPFLVGNPYPTNVLYEVAFSALDAGPATPTVAGQVQGQGTTNATYAWSPAAADVGNSFQVTVEARNDGGSSTESFTVTILMGELTSFNVTPVEGNGGALSMAFQKFDAADSVTILYSKSESDLAGISTPADTWPASVAAAYVGAGSSPQTLSGLDACTTYYFKIWEKPQNAVIYSQSLTASATTVEPAAPTNLRATDLSASGFTAAWNASAGALGYTLNVWHFEGGSGEDVYEAVTEYGQLTDGDYVILDEDCTYAMLASASGTTYLYSTNSGYTFNSGDNTVTSPDPLVVWHIADNATLGGYTFYNEATNRFLAANNSITALEETANASKHAFDLTIYEDDSILPTSLASSTYKLYFNSSAPRFKTYSSEQKYLRFYKKTGGTRVADVTDREVTDVSSAVTGLTQDTPYYFSVSAHGADSACTSAVTFAETTTLEGVPSPLVTATDGDYFNKVALSWSAITGATGYKIYRSEFADTNSAVCIGTVNSGATVAFNDTGSVGGLVLGQTYYYWVRTVSSSGESKFRTPDAGYAGRILYYTGVEGRAQDAWLGHTANNTTVRPDHMRHMPAALYEGANIGSCGNLAGDYAWRIPAAQALRMADVVVPAAGANLLVRFNYALNACTAGDVFALQFSADGSSWTTEWSYEVTAGNEQKPFGVQMVSVPSSIVSAGGRFAVRFVLTPASGTAGFAWVDEIMVISGSDLPGIGFANGIMHAEPTDETVTVPVTITSAANATATVAVWGTAKPGAGYDYVISSTNITFSAGGPTTQNLTINLNADDIAEGTEIIHMTLDVVSGARPGNNPSCTLFLMDDDGFIIMTANLGDSVERDRIFSFAHPDIIALQNFKGGETKQNFLNNLCSYASYNMTTLDKYLPIVTRYEILDQGTIEAGVTSRWATVRLPGSIGRNLTVFNVDLPSGASARTNAAAALVTAISDLYENGTDGFDTHSFLAVAGCFNGASGHSDAAVELLTASGLVTDYRRPTDSKGSQSTLVSGSGVEDFILVSQELAVRFQPFDYYTQTFSDGMVVDTREWGMHPLPALACDSSADDSTHRPVMQLYTLGSVVDDPTLSVSDSTTATTINWTLIPNAYNHSWVLVRNTTGAFETPVAGTQPGDVGDSFAGGIVVAIDDEAPSSSDTGTDTGLIACQTYYYRAYSFDASYNYSPGFTTAFATTTEPAAPINLANNEVGETYVAITWDEVVGSGADHYELSVSTQEFASASTTIHEISFLSSNLVGTGVSAGTWTIDGKCDKDAQGVKMGTGKATGTVTSPQMDLSADGGNVELTVVAKSYGSDGEVTITVKMNTGSGFNEIARYTVPSSESFAKTITVSGASATTTFTVSTTANGKRIYLESFTATQGGGFTPLPGYDSIDVSGGSYTITGLDESTTYCWGLRPVGGCRGDWVTNFVTTLAGPIIRVEPLQLNFGVVEKSDSANPTGETRTITVYNDGHAQLTIDTISFAGDGDHPAYCSATPATPITVPAGQSTTITVRYAPLMGGTLSATMNIANNSEAASVVPVTLMGSCRDPETAPPTIDAYSVTDVRDTANTVYDGSLRWEDQPVRLEVIARHVTGIRGNDASVGDRPKWNLIRPDGITAVFNQERSFDATESTVYQGNQAMRLVVSNLPAVDPATLGNYLLRVTVKSTNGKVITQQSTYSPLESYMLLDDFNRENVTAGAAGVALGNGWTAFHVTSTLDNIAIANNHLVLNGDPNYSLSKNGKVGAYVSIVSQPYAKILEDNTSALTWGFNFASGRANLSTLAGGQYAGAFVLGATETGWESGSGSGYAVLMANNAIQLVKFSSGLSSMTGVTTIGEPVAIPNSCRGAIAVKVTFTPDGAGEGGTFALYVRDLGGIGPAFFNGAPVVNQTLTPATIAADDTYTDVALNYGGVLWNFAGSEAGEGVRAVFDDIYYPHAEGQGVRMEVTVVDDDEEVPVFHDFTTLGALSDAYIPDGGFVVTGFVHDVSGIINAATNAPSWVLTRADSASPLASGTFTVYSNAFSASNPECRLECTIAKANLAVSDYDYTFTVSACDADGDHDDDSLCAEEAFVFRVTDQVLTDPRNVHVYANGPELDEVHWETDGNWVVIVRSESEIPETFNLTQAQEYQIGDTFDSLPGAEVVYAGNGTWVDGVCSGAKEFYTEPGHSYYYRVFGAAYNYYTRGFAPENDNAWPVHNSEYEPGEIVETFSYVAPIPAATVVTDQWKWAVSFPTDVDTGNEWNGTWTFGNNGADAGVWKIHDANLVATNYYPTPVGNKLYWNDIYEEGTEPEAHISMTRKLKTPLSGKIFVAFQMNFMYKGAGKYASVALMAGPNADREIVSFGKQGNWEDLAGFSIPGGTFVEAEAKSYSEVAGRAGVTYALEGGTGKDYAIVGEIDTDEHVIRMWAFAPNQLIQQDFAEACTNDNYCMVATYSNAAINSSTVSSITGVRVQAGHSSGVCMGHVYFDEIRMGPTWDETLLFNNPEVFIYNFGRQYGTDDEGRPLWEIADGALAHSEVPLNLDFTLYHRTGITNAWVTILNQFHTNEPFWTPRAELQPVPGPAGTGVTPEWTSSSAVITNVIPTTNIVLRGASNDEYTVQVQLLSVGGKENITTSASEGGGTAATDLFFGEYGEGARNDKYVELYNGTGHDIDLSQYYVLRVRNDQPHADGYYGDEIYNCAQISSESYILPHHETAVLLNYMKGNDTANSRLAIMKGLLEANGCKVLQMTNDVLDASGKAPLLLMKAEDFAGVSLSHLDKPWLDACGDSKAIVQERFIMSRKADTQLLPRSAPLTVDTNEWDYRGWDETKDDCDYPNYTNFLATAGVYDREIGLGGAMVFTVYDDDTQAPVLGEDSAIILGTNTITAQPGASEIVLAAWNFTNDCPTGTTVYSNVWERSMMKGGTITFDPAFVAYCTNNSYHPWQSSGSPENLDFGAYEQIQRGAIQIQPKTNWISAAGSTYFVIKTPMVSATDRFLTFATYATTNSFLDGKVYWSVTGGDLEEDWHLAGTSWNPSEYTDWTTIGFDLADVPEQANALYLRFLLTGHSGKGNLGAVRFDNIQIIGYPKEFSITDAELKGNGLTFSAHIYDTNSGVDYNSLQFAVGDFAGTLTTSQGTWNSTYAGGKSTSSIAEFQIDPLSKADVTAWYNASISNGLLVTATASDADDDRFEMRNNQLVNVDAETLYANFGNFAVSDDDPNPPIVELTSMRTVGSSLLVQWRYENGRDGTRRPTRWNDSLVISPIAAKAVGSDPKSIKWRSAKTANNTYPQGASNDTQRAGAEMMYQNGWHYGTKYWYFTITPDTDVTVAKLSVDNYINSVYSPKGFTLRYGEEGGQMSNVIQPLFNGGADWTTEDVKRWYHVESTFDNPVLLEANHTYEFQMLGTGGDVGHGVGAEWGLYDLCLTGIPTGTNGLTEIFDSEAANGGVIMHGWAYDEISGLPTTNRSVTSFPDNVPQFSLVGPNGYVFAKNEVLRFATAQAADGARLTKNDGEFSNPLPALNSYTNIFLGEYGGEISLGDVDDDRIDDDLKLRQPIAFYVIDNDVIGPTNVGTIRVNGSVISGSSREAAPWTNSPIFNVTFDEPAYDREPTEEWLTNHNYRATQNQVSGIGEYRVTLLGATGNTDEARYAAGVPYSVAVTNGALANYGFEMGLTGWECSGATIASAHTATYENDIPEGTNALRIASGGYARQTFEYVNNGVAPTVTLTGLHKGPAVHVIFRAYDASGTQTGSPLDVTVAAAADWTAFAIGEDTPVTIGNAATTRIVFSIEGAADPVFVDNLRLGIDTGAANKPSMRFDVGGNKEAQGLVEKYLFSVDADNNRPDDRSYGPLQPFMTAYDITPPTAVGINHAFGASTENVDDPTTQFDLDWSQSKGGSATGAIGPDDPDSANYLSAWGSSKDVLSPWATYKIYYGTYDSLDCEQAVAGGEYANSEAYIYGKFIGTSTTNSYKNWPYVTSTNAIEDPSATGASYSTLTNAATRQIRLYDLDFDQDYVVVLVGVDKAGNEGPANNSSWATNNTIKFAITQGVMRARAFVEAAWHDNHNMKDGDRETAALYWNAAASGGGEVKRDYDLIYWDAASFNESSNNTWFLISTVRSNWFTDAGALTNAATRLRFYRAAYKDRWRTVNPTTTLHQRPLVSEDVYAMSAVQLTEAANYVSLHGYAYTNTIAGIFGTDTNIWPAGEDATESTRIESYAQGSHGAATNETPRPAQSYWLGIDGAWHDSVGANANNVIDTNLFLYGCNIVLPSLSEAQRQFAITNGTQVLGGIYWHPILRVPTNNIIEVIQGQTQPSEEFTVVIKRGSTRTGAAWNFCSFMLPVQCHPSKLGLEETDFTPSSGTTLDAKCSILYAYDSLGKKVRAGSGMFLGSDGQWHSIYNGSVIYGTPFRVNDVLIIVERNPLRTRADDFYEWTYKPSDFYSFPTRWSGW